MCENSQDKDSYPENPGSVVNSLRCKAWGELD